MTLDPNAKKAAYDAALPALNRNAAPFHVIDLAIEAYLDALASRPSAIVEPMAVQHVDPSTLDKAIRCDLWPDELHAIVDQVCATSDAGDLSTEQCVALGILLDRNASPQPHTGRAEVTEAQAAYALLWRTHTTDEAIHAARRSLLNTIGKDGQRAALQWALDTFGPTPEPLLEDMP